MKYAQILNKIRESYWLITPDGLDVVLSIVDRHVNADGVVEVNMADIRAGRGREERELNVVRGIGILPLTGPIFGKANLMTQLSGATSLEVFSKDLSELLADDSVSSILLQIDSPGGTSDLVRETGDQIFNGRKEKPIYAISDTMAGSAAYWLGSQADALYTTLSGSVGSIGVYTVHEDRSAADAQAGRKYTYIHAGQYKTEGNPHEPLTEEGRQFRQEQVDELYGEFLDAVARGRNTNAEAVKENFGGGRMFTANKALEAGMVDGITTTDNLIGHMLNQPRKIQVAIGDKRAAGVLNNGVLTLSLDASKVFNSAKLEHADLEHSEPGTGSPPLPRSDGEADKAAETGSRRDPLPLPPEDPKAPKPNAKSNGGNMADEHGSELESRLRAALNLSADDDIESAVTNLVAEVEPLRQATAHATEEQRFAREYPAMYREHVEQREANMTNKASAFVQSIRTMKRTAGERMIDSNFGISALAADTVLDAHKKFAKGEGTLADFEKSIAVIMNGGMVEYGERGSSIPVAETSADTSTMVGIANTRKVLAAKVAEIQENDKVDYRTALNLAAERYPDLAAAYKVTVPGVEG